MQSHRPTMTSTPSTNTLSDRTADRREYSRLSRASSKVVEGTTLATLWKPDLHPCTQRGSPEPAYASQDWDLSARFDSGTHSPGPQHLRPIQHRPGPNRERYASPCGNRPALLFPPGHLLRLHGDLYLAIPGRNGRTHSPLSVSRPGKEGSPSGRKVSRRCGCCHDTLRNSRPWLFLPHVWPLWLGRQVVCL